MKDLENGLTRRSFLGNSLKTAGGIILIGGASNILSSCGIGEDKHYKFDLSRLNSWQVSSFLDAGESWNIYDGRDDSSRNKVYFGKMSGTRLATARREVKTSEQDIFSFEEPEKIYTFTITFNKDANWVNCDLEGEWGFDFNRVARHEWGHILGYEHSTKPNDIMYPYISYGCFNDSNSLSKTPLNFSEKVFKID